MSNSFLTKVLIVLIGLTCWVLAAGLVKAEADRVSDPGLSEVHLDDSGYLLLLQPISYAEFRENNPANQSKIHSAPMRKPWIEALKQHAAKQQAPVIAFLESQGISYRSFWISNALHIQAEHTTLKALQSRFSIRAIEKNGRFSLNRNPPAESTMQKGSITSSLTQISADQVWAAGFHGEGVTVGIQDTGVDWEHSLLKTQYRGWDGVNANHDYNWHDAIHVANAYCDGDSSAPCDDNGHGTHVTGTVAGQDQAGTITGVAPGANWIACRNMNSGYGTPTTYMDCFQWFLAPTRINGSDPRPDLAPDVINNSWACPPIEGCAWQTLEATVNNVEAAGILVVSAATNGGPSCESIRYPPAIYEASFSVGAVDGQNGIVSFSSRGPVMIDGSERLKPNLVAPGSNILSASLGGFLGTSSGTSMAAPHVAGVAALLLQANTQLKGRPDKLRGVMEKNADPLYSGQACGGLSGSAHPNAVYGWGVVNAYKSYLKVLEPVYVDGFEN